MVLLIIFWKHEQPFNKLPIQKNNGSFSTNLEKTYVLPTRQ